MDFLLGDNDFSNYDVDFSVDSIFEYLHIEDLESQPLNRPTIDKISDIADKLNACMKRNDKIYIYGDYDTDGVMCAVQWLRFFEQVEYENVSVYNYKLRMHQIEPSAITEAINTSAKLMIICDTGSGVEDVAQLQRAVAAGVDVIVLDHHTVEGYDSYPEGVTAINSILERELGTIDFPCSGGSLTYIVVSEILRKHFDKSAYQQLFCAIVSLYADQVPMNNAFNRNLYYECMSLPDTVAPTFIKVFFGRNNIFRRRFIEWTFSPRVNALFRAERFDVLNDLFLIPDTVLNKSALVGECIAIHKEGSEFVELLLSQLSTTILEKKHFVVCDMSKSLSYHDNTNYLNYSGLLANKLSDRFGKIAVVYGRDGSTIRGSVRDLLGRDLLSYLSVFTDAGGHRPAFGFHMDQSDLSDFMENLDVLDSMVLDFKKIQQPIVFNADIGVGASDIECIALYNEFAGGDILPCFIQKKITSNISMTKTAYNFRYDWSGYTIISKDRLLHGSNAIIKPTLMNGVNLYAM
jgi:single-stranded-DNA-specific exonuclease